MLDRAILTTAMNPGFGGPPLDNFGQMIGVLSLNLNSLKEMSLAIPIDLFHTSGTACSRSAEWLADGRGLGWGFTPKQLRGGGGDCLDPERPCQPCWIEVKDVILEVDHVEIVPSGVV